MIRHSYIVHRTPFGAWLVALVGLSLIIGGCERKKVQAKDEVCFAVHCFEVEIADTPDERQQGLMFRESLDQDKGMLFVFDKSERRGFWMKNTLIPLDFIWLDHSQRVVDISHNVPICEWGVCPSYYPKESALYVLEINGGLSPKMGIAVGDRAEFRLPSMTAPKDQE